MPETPLQEARWQRIRAEAARASADDAGERAEVRRRIMEETRAAAETLRAAQARVGQQER